MLERFVEWAEANGWNVVTDTEKTELPEEITRRYDVPEQWYEFISRIKKCENSTADKWFLTPGDYLPQEEGFQWNEFERLSLEWDSDSESSIVSFWDRHLPIFLSVDGEYSYYAIDTENGSVVGGCEPEFEEPSEAAGDINAFIDGIISGEIQL